MMKNLKKILIFLIIFFNFNIINFAEIIENYETTVKILNNGKVEITENIEYDFGKKKRHGFYRKLYSEKYNQYEKSLKEQGYKVSDLEVTHTILSVKRNGENEIYSKLKKGNVEINKLYENYYKFGDKKKIKGKNTYELKYLLNNLTKKSSNKENGKVVTFDLLNKEARTKIKKYNVYFNFENKKMSTNDIYNHYFPTFPKDKYKITDTEKGVKFEFDANLINKKDNLIFSLSFINDKINVTNKETIKDMTTLNEEQNYLIQKLQKYTTSEIIVMALLGLFCISFILFVLLEKFSKKTTNKGSINKEGIDFGIGALISTLFDDFFGGIGSW